MNDYITRIDNFIAPLAEQAGVRVARVGGSVRDEILGRRVKDADYVVFGQDLDSLGWVLKNTLPFCEGQLTRLKLRDGRQAGWRLFKKGYGLIEIMLPRTEVSTGPGHRDFKIVLDPSLTPEQDAIRRDFTFNALYRWIQPEGSTTTRVLAQPDENWVLRNVTDPTGRGLYDLQHKLVCTTHPDSFRDDPLRILRALRFVSVLGYDLSTAAEAQMREHAEAAHGLSAVYKGKDATEAASGTVLDEMSKLLMGDDVGKALRLMRDTGVMAVVLPELAPMLSFEQSSKYHDLTTDEHTFTALEAAAKADAPLVVRWSLLFHDAGKPESAWTDDKGRQHFYAKYDNTEDHEVVGERIWRQVCKRLNVPKDLREGAALLIREHMVTLQPKNPGVKVRRWRVKYGDEMLSNLLLHRACDCMGKQRSAEAQVRQVGRLVMEQNAAEAAGVPSSVKDLEIGGKDLIEMGACGREIGEILAKVLDEVVCQPDELRRRRDWQLARAEALR